MLLVDELTRFVTTGAAIERAAKAAVMKTDFIFATEICNDLLYGTLVDYTGECDSRIRATVVAHSKGLIRPGVHVASVQIPAILPAPSRVWSVEGNRLAPALHHSSSIVALTRGTVVTVHPIL